jgi:hypothetical protein
MPDEELVIMVSLADSELLHLTAIEYLAAVEREEMTEEEALGNLEMLCLGMMTFE